MLVKAAVGSRRDGSRRRWSPNGNCCAGSLKAARERRLRLDPNQLAREQRIDEAVVDVEVAWEARATAERAVTNAEVATAAAMGRLVEERLALKDVVQLTGLDQATVRRLRQLEAEADYVGTSGEDADTPVA